MVSQDDVIQIIGNVLQIGDRALKFDANTQLLGSVPEFDSMAVVSILTALEESFGIYIDDDEISAELFETVGQLHEFVSSKVDN